MNIILFSTSWVTISIAYLISVEGGTLVEENVETIKANIKIKNPGLKCYQCNDTSCDKPRNASGGQVQNCSDLKLNSLRLTDDEYVDYDFSNIAYTCIKMTTNNVTERGCSFDKIDNKEYCDVSRALLEGINDLYEVFNKLVSRGSGRNNEEKIYFKCSICDTDLCNSV